MSDRLIPQRMAANVLGVSVSYLRASTCPRILLPSNGRGSKPFLRYRLSELLAWACARRV